MKKLCFIIFFGFLMVSVNIYAVVNQNDLKLAHEGCQKPLGFFPTPAKLMCMLTAFGKSDKDIKAKAIAIIFTTCQGHLLVPQHAGYTPKKYPNLATCLSDPMAITLINNELTAKGFPAVTVVNTEVLSPAPQAKPALK